MNIYHRIYKLYQRKISVQQIAATTHMPIHSVREIIRKFNNKNKNPAKNIHMHSTDPYLDYHVFRHQKYTTIDFSGFLIDQFKDTVTESISEVRQQLGQTLAIKLDEVVSIDMEAMAVLINFNDELSTLAKNLILLSPSEQVEVFIHQHNIEDTIRIFGTLSAFEEHAFNLSHGK